MRLRGQQVGQGIAESRLRMGSGLPDALPAGRTAAGIRLSDPKRLDHPSFSKTLIPGGDAPTLAQRNVRDGEKASRPLLLTRRSTRLSEDVFSALVLFVTLTVPTSTTHLDAIARVGDGA